MLYNGLNLNLLDSLLRQDHKAFYHLNQLLKMLFSNNSCLIYHLSYGIHGKHRHRGIHPLQTKPGILLYRFFPLLQLERPEANKQNKYHNLLLLFAEAVYILYFRIYQQLFFLQLNYRLQLHGIQ